jgi:hypothetical protein
MQTAAAVIMLLTGSDSTLHYCTATTSGKKLGMEEHHCRKCNVQQSSYIRVIRPGMRYTAPYKLYVMRVFSSTYSSVKCNNRRLHPDDLLYELFAVLHLPVGDTV